MRFIADVNVAQVVIRFLRQSGHDVVDIKQQSSIEADIDIIKLSRIENRIILTHDKDFLGLTEYPKYRVGMIVIRLLNQKTRNHLQKLKQIYLNSVG